MFFSFFNKYALALTCAKPHTKEKYQIKWALRKSQISEPERREITNYSIAS